MFESYGSGNKAERDKICIHLNRQSLEYTLNDFKNLEVEAIRTKYELKKDSRDWSVQRAKDDVINTLKELEKSNTRTENSCHTERSEVSQTQKDISAFARQNTQYDKAKAFQKIAYRPFDTRFTFFTGKSKGFWGTPSGLSKHFLQGENLGLCTTKISHKVDYSYGFIIDKIADVNFSGQISNSDMVIPLYLYKNENELDKLEAVPNFTKEFLDFKEKSEVLKDKTPEQILAFIYATLYNPNYRQKYLEYLKIGFPRINFEVSVKEFDFFAKIGQKLMNLHLMKEPLNDDEIDFEGEFKTSIILKALRESERYKENAIFLDEKLKITGISKDIWEYKIGGYEVLKTWLKYRKNKELFKEDLEHFLQICIIIKRSLALQYELENFTL